MQITRLKKQLRRIVKVDGREIVIGIDPYTGTIWARLKRRLRHSAKSMSLPELLRALGMNLDHQVTTEEVLNAPPESK